jgi:hypothetical protein
VFASVSNAVMGAAAMAESRLPVHNLKAIKNFGL